MRIPFDLIAAVICIEGIGSQLLMEVQLRMAAQSSAQLRMATQEIRFNAALAQEISSVSINAALLAWGAFLLISWLINELIARDMEWRTRFGHHPSGLAGKLHQYVIH